MVAFQWRWSGIFEFAAFVSRFRIMQFAGCKHGANDFSRLCTPFVSWIAANLALTKCDLCSYCKQTEAEIRRGADTAAPLVERLELFNVEGVGFFS